MDNAVCHLGRHMHAHCGLVRLSKKLKCQVEVAMMVEESMNLAALAEMMELQ